MKKRVFFALLAAAAVTFVGCSKDDDGPDEGPRTYTITFEGDEWNPLVAAAWNGGLWTGAVAPADGQTYTWTDATTSLTSPYPEGYGYPWILSSYNSNDLTKFNNYEVDLYVYNSGNVDATTGGGNNGSNNFLIGNGYNSDYGDSRPTFQFADGTPRTIQSCYINSTCYFLAVASQGNEFTPALTDSDEAVMLHATGYDANGNETATISRTFAKKDQFIQTWTKWDLSGLGKVVKVRFNMTGGPDNGYGFSMPAYYAVDDITIEL